MCLFFKFLYWLFPFRDFRVFILRAHMDRCQLCRGEYEIDELIQEALNPPGWIKDEPSLWPGVDRRIGKGMAGKTSGEKKAKIFRKWAWVTASLVLAAAVLLVVWSRKNGGRYSPSEEAAINQNIPQVTIKRAELNGKKAASYVYQTPEISFIWFSEHEKNGDSQ